MRKLCCGGAGRLWGKKQRKCSANAHTRDDEAGMEAQSMALVSAAAAVHKNAAAVAARREMITREMIRGA